MNRIFPSLHARAFCHATEELDKVKMAVLNAVGEGGFSVTKGEGHHGNSIEILEAAVYREGDIIRFFERFDKEDIEALRGTLNARVDEGCNLFVKVDKQSAFKGIIKLGTGDDVISVRVKIRAFPAKAELAKGIMDEFLGHTLCKKD
ncbi:MAG: hypothetical protein A3K60_03345 [Euryarchaeota archaeon RBG_19FT_COMBO_56_21]|nr:MAG: hypothetical protein A3K60_03345 [Euryarchaeota archaeon RBG_19FT_COMBO_56_21]